MLKSYLLENYGYNEPIFLNDLKIEELSENAVRQSVKRLVANGFLERFDKGIYYIPKQDGLLGKSYLDPLLVIMRKYVRNESDTYGYLTGMAFANQLGLTTQVPAIIEIVTNREATNGRTVTVGNQKVRIKKATVNVSDNNADILQFLDCIGQAEKYTELSIVETIENMSTYVKGKGFTREQLAGVSSVITGATAKKLIEWGLVYEFVSQ
ncbi:MAG: hypothetical protein IJN54_03080 [Lachnospiraceae bacterium]|nr:hypothetical protein [Lachnospiraceae bacterium]